MQERSGAHDLGLDVSSAGTRWRLGRPMHPQSRRVLAEGGPDVEDLYPRMLYERTAGNQYLVAGLARNHRAAGASWPPIGSSGCRTGRDARAGGSSVSPRDALDRTNQLWASSTRKVRL
ncbi:hypothetical protein [Williamsia sp. D3]|uniref:hypothetical protein n=1 Tax=Williamsia sp. D3 TaxID=1313067 RepID=UPI0009DF0727|nr:hypothetical protein [Williamsia sp. D3]